MTVLFSEKWRTASSTVNRLLRLYAFASSPMKFRCLLELKLELPVVKAVLNHAVEDPVFLNDEDDASVGLELQGTR